MDTWVWIVIAVAALVIVAFAGYAIAKQRRRRELRTGFGTEYDRTLEDAESRREAEAELRERVKRHDELELRPLDTELRNRYSAQWKDVQARFVDDPPGAIRAADTLIQEVMVARGYPVEDFDQRAADLSVDHGDAVESYRAAHAISERSEAGDATTEELRTAIVHYRVLFDDMLETDREHMEVRQ